MGSGPAARPAPLTRLQDEELERRLASGEHAREFAALFGEDAGRELSALAARAAAVRQRGGPRVYLLPGLMGSRLGSRGRLVDDVLWVDLVEIAAGHLLRLALPRGAGLAPLGAMLLNALKLKLTLQLAGFDVRLHAYDWRLGLEPLGRELHARLVADDSRDALLLGHSMGGLVARAALAHEPRRIARLLQIGSPNAGSFAPLLALRGVYPTVRKIAALDRRHSAEDLARLVFRTLPALVELLPAATDCGGLDLFDPAAWPDDALRPDAALLAASRGALARLPPADARCLQIVGVRQETITAVRRGTDGFEYRITRDGDGTVPLALARWPGARTWYAEEKHGGLTNHGTVISAAVDLLRSGDTDRLPETAGRAARRPPPRTLTEPMLRRVAPHKVRWQDLTPDARRRLLEPVVSPEFHGDVAAGALAPDPGRGAAPPADAGRRTLELRLLRGDVAEASARALTLAVFAHVDPTGAAAAVDRRLDGAVRDLALRRALPTAPGEVVVLPVPRAALLAEFVLFVGLGEFDELAAATLERAAAGSLAALLRSGAEDFATVVFGAGSGLPVRLALEHQLRGYVAALEAAGPGHGLRRITLCEIDPRKYEALRRGIGELVRELSPGGFELVFDEAVAAPPAGPRTRRSDDPVYLLVNWNDADRGRVECRSALLTAGAKAAVLAGTRSFSRRELDALLRALESGTLGARELGTLGARLARELLAAPVLEGLADTASRPLVVVHDREASRVPWETLQVGGRFPALERGLSRRYAGEGLSVARWRESRRIEPPLRVLLVADPTGDLPGARREAAILDDALAAAGARVERLTGRAARRAAVLAALGSGAFDVLHFAGHGCFVPERPGRSGLVLADDEVLGGSALEALGPLPFLVFCNACEAARVRRASGRAWGRRGASARSASIAEAFLAGGVASYVGTHWPVGDDAALLFSRRCYAALLAGGTLGESVLAARRAVRELGSIDWADYVHYGHGAITLAGGP